MATVKLVKKSAAHPANKLAKGAANPADFSLVDNQDNTLTVQGVDSAGQPVDISGVATINATSDNPAVISVDPPTGMTFAIHGLTVGSANLTIVATWNDGSVGPFTITLPGTCTGGAPAGITVTFGTPTVRP